MPTTGCPDDLRHFVCGLKRLNLQPRDLRHFADCIRSRDLAAMQICRNLRPYAARQFEWIGAPIITMALVQGDALKLILLRNYGITSPMPLAPAMTDLRVHLSR
jgi:hypothetical protein